MQSYEKNRFAGCPVYKVFSQAPNGYLCHMPDINPAKPSPAHFNPMIKIGEFNTLTVLRITDFGIYLDDAADGILLPVRFVPEGIQVDDNIEVFLYHDSEQRVIATTLEPRGIVGDIVRLKVVDVNDLGAFLDNGLMKDLLLPKKKLRTDPRVGDEVLVKIYIEEFNGMIAATEWVEEDLDNTELTVEELDEVDVLIWRKTDLGYAVIINNIHEGLLYHNEIYRNVEIGDRFPGFVKSIKSGNKLDIALGQMGYDRVEGESEKVMRMLQEQDGFMPYHDKSSPEEIYDMFSMSKKTFKMTIGNLYKEKKIQIFKDGIKLIKEEDRVEGDASPATIKGETKPAAEKGVTPDTTETGD